MSSFLIRIDDVCQQMDFSKLDQFVNALAEKNISGFMGIIPCNKYEKLYTSKNSESFFWAKVKEYNEKGWIIAQHGTYHNINQTSTGGILEINRRGEFCNYTYIEQLELIRKGKEIMLKNDVWTPYFMPPAHWLDINTINALKKLDFKFVLDGYGFKDYQEYGISFVPQLFSRFQNLIFGQYCTCFHINNYDSNQIDELIKLTLKHKKNIIRPENRKYSSSSLFILISRYVTKKILLTIRRLRKLVKAYV
jgi:predicted deacetylase